MCVSNVNGEEEYIVLYIQVCIYQVQDMDKVNSFWISDCSRLSGTCCIPLCNFEYVKFKESSINFYTYLITIVDYKSTSYKNKNSQLRLSN